MLPRAVLALTLASCAHVAARAPDVPIAFGRWRAPEGQSCYVDELQPRELPSVSALLDSARLVGDLRSYPAGDVLVALVFDSSGRVARAHVIDRRTSAATADSVRDMVASRVQAPRIGAVWGARLLVSTGPQAALALGRRELCPPVLARIQPLAQLPITVPEREPELVPPPDWIVRGAAPPAGPARTTAEKTIAGKAPRDSARLTVDSISTEPDATALGDSALTLRVLIDSLGTIAHAEIARAAAAGLDRQRLVAELGRYRFHPGLEDRVPTPWWVILKIK